MGCTPCEVGNCSGRGHRLFGRVRVPVRVRVWMPAAAARGQAQTAGAGCTVRRGSQGSGSAAAPQQGMGKRGVCAAREGVLGARLAWKVSSEIKPVRGEKGQTPPRTDGLLADFKGVNSGLGEGGSRGGWAHQDGTAGVGAEMNLHQVTKPYPKSLPSELLCLAPFF